MNSIETNNEATRLVDQLADSDKRWDAYEGLVALGSEALPAVRAGLGNGHWQVRRWCTILLDHLADPETLEHLIPLLHDPKSNVRMWAVHSLSCDRCKKDANPIDVVPLLIERIEHDESIRVRRMAVAMLGHHVAPDERVVPVFEAVLEGESDRKLRLHAEEGLSRYREAGLPNAHGTSDRVEESL